MCIHKQCELVLFFIVVSLFSYLFASVVNNLLSCIRHETCCLLLSTQSYRNIKLLVIYFLSFCLFFVSLGLQNHKFQFHVFWISFQFYLLKKNVVYSYFILSSLPIYMQYSLVLFSYSFFCSMTCSLSKVIGLQLCVVIVSYIHF